MFRSESPLPELQLHRAGKNGVEVCGRQVLPRDIPGAELQALWAARCAGPAPLQRKHDPEARRGNSLAQGHPADSGLKPREGACSLGLGSDGPQMRSGEGRGATSSRSLMRDKAGLEPTCLVCIWLLGPMKGLLSCGAQEDPPIHPTRSGGCPPTSCQMQHQTEKAPSFSTPEPEACGIRRWGTGGAQVRPHPSRAACVSSPSRGSQWGGHRAAAPPQHLPSSQGQEAQAWQDAVPRLDARTSQGWRSHTAPRQARPTRPSTGVLSLGPWDPSRGIGEARGTQGLGSQDGGS